MLTKTIKIILVILIINLGIFSGLNATSFFSTKGLGLNAETVGAQGMAMGGVGISLLENRGLSSLSPATLIPDKVTRISVHFNYNSTSQQNSQGSGHTNYVNTNGVQLLVPIATKYAFSLGISPLFISDYKFEIPGIDSEKTYREIYGSKGSLNKLFISVFSNIKNRATLGLSYNYALGKYDKSWQIVFDKSQYVDTNDRLRTKLRGHYVTAGLVLLPFKTWRIGAVYSSPLNLKSENQYEHNFQITVNEFSKTYATTSLNDQSLDLPHSWGVGTTFEPNSKLLFSIDYFAEPFSQIKNSNESENSEFNDYYRISAGFQYLPSTNPYSKFIYHIPLRSGFFYKQLPIKYGNNEPLYEYGVSFGAGLPFYFLMGRIDFACQFGKRGNIGDNLVEEKFFNLMITATGGERWFIHGRKN